MSRLRDMEYWRKYRPYLAGFAIFVSSRLIVLLGIAFADKYLPSNPAGEFWNSTEAWYRYLLRYDSGYYLRIASQGYSYNGNDLEMQNVVFYPVYPWVSRGLMFLFGASDNLALLIVSNLSIIAAVLLMIKLTKDESGSEVAIWTVAFLSFFPTAVFFSAGYTESTALLIIIAFFLFLKKGRFFLAAACAGLATATRSTGVVLLLPLLWELWRRFSTDRVRLGAYVLGCGLVAVSGLGFFMLYLWKVFGKPLALMTGTRAWQISAGHQESAGYLTEGNLYRALTLKPLRQLAEIFDAGPNPNTLDPWLFLLFFLLILALGRRLPLSYFLYALGVLLLPYLTISGSLGFESFGRYVLLAFPVFIILGQVSAKRHWLGVSLTAIFASLLLMYSAMFARWYWIG